MKTRFWIIILMAGLIIGCKKDYTCGCGNLSGVHETYKIRNTKKKAEAECHSLCIDCYSGSEKFCELQ
jgi:hypothetical protein